MSAIPIVFQLGDGAAKLIKPAADVDAILRLGDYEIAILALAVLLVVALAARSGRRNRAATAVPPEAVNLPSQFSRPFAFRVVDSAPL